MSYGSLIGSGGFVAGSLPTVVGYVGIVTNNPSLKQLQLYYTQAPQPVKWAVGSGNWDTTSPDWTILGGGGLTNYVEGSPVLFDDSASGSSPITITLVGNRSPGGITNAASAKTYMLTGSPNILSGSVVVNGGGTLVVDNGSGNNFSAVAISSGALQLGNGDTGGSLGNGAITDNGTLVLDRTDNLNLGNAISGTGGLTQNGSDAVTITAANTFAGGTAINAGDVVMGNASALSTNTITIGSGATLDLDGNGATLSGLQSIVAAGAGLGGIGAIYSSGAGNNNAFRNVTLTGDMTIGGPATAIIGLRTTANSDPGLIAHGYNLTKMGGCQVNFNGGTTVAGITNTWFQDIGNIDIQGGVLSFERHAALGNPTNTITVESGATLQLFSLTPTNPVPTNGIVLNNGMLQSTGGTAGDTNTLGGQITLNGLANSINAVSGFYLAVEGPIVGSGGVVYAGAVSLSGANTYTGNTIISSGTLSLIGAGTVANSSTISVGIGATLDASGLPGEFALGAGQTLSNSASATGNLNAGAGGINTGSGQVSVSYLSNTPPLNIVGGTLNLSAATVVAVNNTGAPLVPGTYDIISSSGSGAVGGTAPVSVSVANGPSAGTPTLSIAGGELYLTVGGTSSISYTGTGPFTYNGLAQGPAAIFTGSTGAQSTLYVGVSVSHGPSAAAPVAAGTYYETNTVAPDANYFGAANSQTFTINPAPLFGQSQIAATTAGTVTLNFAGTPGYSYTVQRSTNLLDAWTAIWTTNAPTGGDFEFIDDPAPQPAAYYRLQYNP
jgi:autotransporter-associated beta strand protein